MVVLLVSSDCGIAVAGNKVAKQVSGGPVEFNQSTILGCGMSQLPHAEFKALMILINGLSSDLEARLRTYKLSTSAFLALDAIARTDVGRAYPMTRASLARMINTTPGSMSVLVSRMKRDGLVTERSLNERSKALATTKLGRSMLAGGSVAWEDTFDGLSKALSPTAKKQLLQTVAKLNLIRKHEQDEECRVAYMRTLSKKETKIAVGKHQEESRAAASRARARFD